MQMTAGDKEWNLFILFYTFSTNVEPHCVTRLFQHTEEEVYVLVVWIMENDKNTRIGNGDHVLARALKLFMISEYGGRMPLVFRVIESFETERISLVFLSPRMFRDGELTRMSVERNLSQ